MLGSPPIGYYNDLLYCPVVCDGLGKYPVVGWRRVSGGNGPRRVLPVLFGEWRCQVLMGRSGRVSFSNGIQCTLVGVLFS